MDTGTEEVQGAKNQEYPSKVSRGKPDYLRLSKAKNPDRETETKKDMAKDSW